MSDGEPAANAPAAIQPFQFNWSGFSWVSGLQYAIGIVIVWAAMDGLGFPWFIGGVAALLAWLTDSPNPIGRRVGGMAVFAAIGIALTFLSDALGTALWPNVLAMFGVAFILTMPMVKGSHPYMVGWSSILWFLYAPLFLQSESRGDVIASLLFGAGVVIALALLGWGLGRVRGQTSVVASQATNPPPSIRFATGYALTVAFVMAVAIFIGWQTIETDPTLVANGAFFVIGPSSRQTWVKGLERIIATFAGIAVGFWLFSGAESEIAVVLLAAIASALCLGMANVNYGAFVFFFVTFMSLGWGLLGLDRGYFAASERFRAELVAVVLAGVAVAALQWWAEHTKEKNHAEARLSTT